MNITQVPSRSASCETRLAVPGAVDRISLHNSHVMPGQRSTQQRPSMSSSPMNRRAAAFAISTSASNVSRPTGPGFFSGSSARRASFAVCVTMLSLDEMPLCRIGEHHHERVRTVHRPGGREHPEACPVHSLAGQLLFLSGCQLPQRGHGAGRSEDDVEITACHGARRDAETLGKHGIRVLHPAVRPKDRHGHRKLTSNLGEQRPGHGGSIAHGRGSVAPNEDMSGSATMVLDGGLSNALEDRAHDLAGALWTARLLQDAPEEIAAVHRRYLTAGASGC